MKEVHFNTGQFFRAFCKSQYAFHKYYHIIIEGSVQLPNCPNILLKTQFYPSIDQRITSLWSSPHARFLLSLCSATKQASPCCYNPLRATAGKSLSCLYLSALLQNKPLHVATILSVLL